MTPYYLDEESGITIYHGDVVEYETCFTPTKERGDIVQENAASQFRNSNQVQSLASNNLPSTLPSASDLAKNTATGRATKPAKKRGEREPNGFTASLDHALHAVIKNPSDITSTETHSTIIQATSLSCAADATCKRTADSNNSGVSPSETSPPRIALPPNIKPYYADDHSGIYIFHGDCLRVLPELPEQVADLIVTDPPYGVSWESGRRTEAFLPISGDHSQEMALAGLTAAIPRLRKFRHLYVFGRYDLSSLPLIDAVELIWDKELMGFGNTSSNWGISHEYIQFTVYVPSRENREDGKGRLAARLRKGSVLRCQRPNGVGVQRHPTEKPVELLRRLIESSSCIGETVLDPFMGSGSTIEASMIEGRRAIGIELEERYCEIAADRVRQGVLFGSGRATA